MIPNGGGRVLTVRHAITGNLQRASEREPVLEKRAAS